MSVSLRSRARLTATGAVLLGLAAAAYAAPASTVLTSALDNPKQPAVGPDGFIYVAQSGHAGPNDPLAGEYPTSLTGSVVKVSSTGAVTPFISGILSRYDEQTSNGPTGIAWWNGAWYVAQALNDQANTPDDQLVSSPVLKVSADAKTRVFTSFNAILNDASGSPEAELDTNPFACAVGADSLLYVSDGAENGIWQVQPNGDSRMFVQLPGDPTTTGLAAVPEPGGPRRASKKSASFILCAFGNGMSGFRNGEVLAVSEGKYRVLVPQNVIYLPIAAAYSPKGQLYILQFALPATDPNGPPYQLNTGAIWSVSPSGTATRVLGGFNFPTGMAFAPDGTAYVTNNGIFGSTPPFPNGPTGQLVKVTGL